MKHTLKTDPAVFQSVADGAKTYEIRFNDRGFAVGDELLLRETTSSGAELAAGADLAYTGREITKHVGHVLTGYGLADGWAILSFAQRATEAKPSASAAPGIKTWQERYAEDFRTKHYDAYMQDEIDDLRAAFDAAVSAAPGMIKRFGPNHWAAGPDGDEFGEQELGEYVLYDDHVAAIAAAREEGEALGYKKAVKEHEAVYDPIIRDLRARLAAPEGYVLVPVEPTPAMLEAIEDEALAETSVEWDSDLGSNKTFGDAEVVYRAMLAAVPQAKAPQQPPAGEDA